MTNHVHRQCYNIRDGAENAGIKYEQTISALIAVRLAFDEEVNDYVMSFNDRNWHYFDDVVLEVKYKSGAVKTFAIQVKQRSKQLEILAKDFCIGKKYNLVHYYEGFAEYKDPNTYFIITTTDYCKRQVVDFTKINKREKVQNWSNVKLNLVNIEHPDLEFIHSLESAKSTFRFDIIDNTEINKLFLKSLYFISNQSKLEDIEDLIRQEIQKRFASGDNIVKSFCDFIENWSNGYKGEYFKLTKHDVILQIIELLILPYVEKPNVQLFDSHNVSHQILIFRNDGSKIKVSERELFKIWNSALNSVDITFIKYVQENIKEYLWIPFVCTLAENLRLEKSSQVFEAEDIFKTFPYLKYLLFGNVINNKITLLDLFIALWKTNEYPLIISDKDETELHQLLNSILEICGKNKLKPSFVLLYRNQHLQFTKKYHKLFNNLNDIKNTWLYTKIINFFPINIQGRYNTTIIDLEEDLLLPHMTTQTLLKMALQMHFVEPLNLMLDEKYINRHLQKAVLHCDVFREEEEIFLLQCKDSSVIPQQKNVFSSPSMNIDHLEDMRRKLGNRNIHLLRHMGDESPYLEHIRTSGTIEKLEKYKTEILVIDDDVIKNLYGNISVIAAIPGMGKSMLFNKWTLSCPENYWPIKICLNEFVDYFENNENENNFLNYYQTYVGLNDVLAKTVFEIFTKRRKLVIFLDGFDEISPYYAEKVFQIIEMFDRFHYTQYISGRPTMKEKLQNRLKIFSSTLMPLDMNGQKTFIVNYFPDQPSALLDLQGLLKQWDGRFSAIPLTLNAICQVYRYQDYRCEYIEKVRLFEEFVKTSIKFYKKKFYGDHHSVEFQEKVAGCMEKTKQIALMLFFERDKCQKYLSADIDLFLDNIRQGKERIGIVTNLTKDGKPVFTHMLIAEYLAALWIAENRYKEFLVSLFEVSKTSIRFWFDRILIKDCPVHRAIMNLDVQELRKLIKEDCDFTHNDSGGRTALHLACSWGPRYNVPGKLAAFFEDEYHVSFRRCIPNHLENFRVIIQILIETGLDPFTKDTLLDADCFYYANNANCLLAIEQLLNHVSTSLESLENIYSKQCLLYYSTKYNFINILEHVLNGKNLNEIYMQCKYGENEKHLLHIAIEYDSTECFEYLVHVIKESINLTDKLLQTPLHLGAKMGQVSLVRKLLLQNCHCDARDYFGNTPLHLATKHKHLQIMKQLLRCKADVDSRNYYGYSPIFYPVETGDKDTFKFLLTSGASTNVVDHEGNTLLHLAIKNKVENLALELFDLSTNLQTRNVKRQTLLHCAVLAENINVLEKLTERQTGIDVDAQDNEGNTALHLAIEKGNSEIVDHLCKNGANINLQNQLGISPIASTARTGHSKLYHKLKEKGANLGCLDVFHNTLLHFAVESGAELIISDILQDNRLSLGKPNIFGKTSVHLTVEKNNFRLYNALRKISKIERSVLEDVFLSAAKNNATEIMFDLLADGVNVNVKNISGKTAAYYAAKRNNLDLLKIFQKHDANFGVWDDSRRSLLHIAVQYNARHILEHLLISGVDINFKDVKGRTAFHYSVEKENVWACEKLKLSGASIIEVDRRLNTSLHIAVEVNSEVMVDKLLEWKSNTNARNHNGRTPLFVAVEKSNFAIYAKLKKYISNLNAIDDNGMTILHVAIEHNAEDIVIDLLENDVDLEIIDQSGKTAIMTAIHCGNIYIYRILKNKGARLNVVDSKKNTPLHLAFMTYDEDIVNDLLINEENFNAKNSIGRTPLHLAVKWADSHFFNKLDKVFLDLNAVDNFGNTPLHLALSLRKTEIVKWFLNKKADVCLKNRMGRTALHLAAQYEVAVYFDNISYSQIKDDLEVEDSLGKTAYSCAEDRNAVEIIKLLNYFREQKKSDLGNIASTSKWSSRAKYKGVLNSLTDLKNMSRNVAYNKLAKLEKLLQSNVDVNTPNIEGKTIMHYAVSVNNFGLFEKLKDLGADLNLKDNKGNTALHLAVSQDNLESVKIVYKCGALTDVENFEGLTPLSLSIIRKNIEIYDFLRNKSTKISTNRHYCFSLLALAAEYHNDHVVNDLLLNSHIFLQNKDTLKNLLKVAISHKNLHLYQHLKNVKVLNDLENISEMVLLATKFNLEQVVDNLLQYCIDINVTDKENKSLIHLAITNGNTKLYKTFKALGSRLDMSDKHQERPIHLAVKHDARDIVEDLLLHECDINATNFYGHTPLYYAMENSKLDVCKKLIQHGADINFLDTRLDTPLHVAVENQANYIVIVLLKHKANVNVKNIMGRTPVLVAIETCDFEMYNTLVENGAHLNTSDKNGMGPLHLAVKCHHAGIVKDLLLRGCGIDARDLEGKTPIQLAIENNNLEIYELLKQQKANIFAVDVYKNNYLHVAARVNCNQILISLLKSKASINEMNLIGKTPLHYIVRWGNEEVFKILGELQIDVNMTDHYGNTPLHLAINYRKSSSIKWLLEMNADVYMINSRGRNAIHFASQHEELSFFENVKELDDRINTEDFVGKSPIQFTIEQNNVKLKEMLLQLGAKSKV